MLKQLGCGKLSRQGASTTPRESGVVLQPVLQVVMQAEVSPHVVMP